MLSRSPSARAWPTSSMESAIVRCTRVLEASGVTRYPSAGSRRRAALIAFGRLWRSGRSRRRTLRMTRRGDFMPVIVVVFLPPKITGFTPDRGVPDVRTPCLQRRSPGPDHASPGRCTEIPLIVHAWSSRQAYTARQCSPRKPPVRAQTERLMPSADPGLPAEVEILGASTAAHSRCPRAWHARDPRRAPRSKPTAADAGSPSDVRPALTRVAHVDCRGARWCAVSRPARPDRCL